MPSLNPRKVEGNQRDQFVEPAWTEIATRCMRRMGIGVSKSELSPTVQDEPNPKAFEPLDETSFLEGR